MWESVKPESRVCVRAFSEALGGERFCSWGAEGGGSSEGVRVETKECRKGVRDMLLTKREGEVECTSKEIQALCLDFFQNWKQ